jgi:hypothetical protein
VAASLDASSGHMPGGQKVTIYFWSDDDPSGGHEHLTGIPVHYTDSANPPNSGLLYTGKQGAVSFQLPRADSSVRLWTDCSVEDGNEVYPAQGPWTIPLPYGLRQNYILLHGAPGSACP